MHIAIIGAGAAGCFAAINIKRMKPQAIVTVYEGGGKPLAKVAVTGGGRCNLTNSFEEVRSLATVYPRGERLMKRLLREFSHKDVYEWFEHEGVRLTTQEDQCVFPVSQDAMEIVNTLTRLMRDNDVRLRTHHRAELIEKTTEGGREHFRINFAEDASKQQTADIVIVATGGSPKAEGLSMLKELHLETVSPVPSLFSICLPGDNITQLMGTVVEDVTASLTGTGIRAKGPLLITHWGMSGPAILKLSSYAARELYGRGYKAAISINWMGDMNENEVMGHLKEIAETNQQKQLSTAYPTSLNSRLWHHLLQKSGLNPAGRWGELGRKGYNRLVNTLTNDNHAADGKNQFKEEFVTCGGISLDNVSLRTLECKTCPGLFFAGEVLDVDAVTGGFNLQAAWTMGYVAAKAVSERYAPEADD